VPELIALFACSGLGGVLSGSANVGGMKGAGTCGVGDVGIDVEGED
jgi:hypothetical protein